MFHSVPQILQTLSSWFFFPVFPVFLRLCDTNWLTFEFTNSLFCQLHPATVSF
jgi:hypothetical protein